MALNKQVPPLDGSIHVLPGFVDFHAAYNPSLPWAVFPSSNLPETEAITFFEFAQATHRIANTLRPGRMGTDGEVVAVLIHCDAVLYLALLVGMVRAGFIPFPMSPRNSREAVCVMLQKTSCHKIIVQPAVSALTSAVQSAMSGRDFAVELIQLPDLHPIFPSLGGNATQGVNLYPPSPVVPRHDDVALYLHSSGSTGFPKPIPQTHRTILQWASCDNLVKSRDRNVRWASAALPTFHTMGIFMQLYAPLTSGEFIGLYAPQAPASPVVPTPQNVIEITRVTKCTAIPSVPAFVEAWAQSAETVQFLASLQILGFAGGPLSDANGGRLAAAGVKLFAIYGGTEFGTPSLVFDTDDSRGPDVSVKTSQDWAWMQFPKTHNTRWIPQGDGTYELHFLTCATHQPAVENLPDMKGYATSDLWEPHPTKNGLWRIVGRTDDVIVLGSGEKIVPVPQEGLLGSLALVNGALMFGRGKVQAGVLIEPRPEAAFDPSDEKALIDFRNKIWPYVEEANKLGPSFARIFKELILVTKPSKPMARAAKGTAMRKVVLASYAEEIEQLYQIVEASTGANGVAPPLAWDIEDVEEWLLQHATSVNRGQEPSSTVDIFEQGFDSLSATYLRNRIIGALRSSRDPTAQAAAGDIAQDFIFANPTVQKLAIAIVQLVHPEMVLVRSKTGADEINEVLAKYSANLPTFNAKHTGTSGEDVVVMLTGSTGNLGCHILASLLQEQRVKKVFTFDRGAAPGERLKSFFKDRGLPMSLLRLEKLSALSGDVHKPGLGLDQRTLEEIRRSVTHIIHNAWRVDFNLSLSSFESHVAGTRKLVDFCLSCAKPVKLLFTSSITVAQRWNASSGLVPEDVLTDPEIAIGAGYGSSKYVTESLLASAKKNGLDTLSLRIGQLCGSTTTGTWNATDWVPIIIKSSLSLGCLPDLPGIVSWIPMDVASRSIVDIVLSSGPLPEVVNLVHPRPVPWHDIFTAVNEALGGRLQLVAFEDWLVKLEASSANVTEQDLENIPAIKLIGFFRLLGDTTNAIQYRTEKAQQVSQTLGTAKPIDGSDIRIWMEYWRSQKSLRNAFKL